MRRLALVVALPLALALAGCGSEGVVAPTAETVVGSLPKAAAGAKLYASNGCGGCHVYTPAKSAGKVGPSLDKLAADAQKANQGPLDQYTFESIKNPGAYVVPGYPNGVMPNFGSTLSDKQISDLVAYLTQKR